MQKEDRGYGEESRAERQCKGRRKRSEETGMIEEQIRRADAEEEECGKREESRAEEIEEKRKLS